MNSLYPNYSLESYQPDNQHHFINKDYPGLQCIHENPYIFIINDFFNSDECDHIISLVPHLKLGKSPSRVRQDKSALVDYKSRKCQTTSIYKNNPIFPELFPYREKIMNLTNVTEEQLEVMNISRYLNGDYFIPHNDAYSPDNWAFKQGICNTEYSNRVVTVLIYLNEVDEGGETRFNDLNLDIKPKKGMALIFFPGNLPNDLNPGKPSENVTHEGRQPINCEKWILQQWCWSGPLLKYR